MQTLTLREVVVACRTALEAKTLIGEVGGECVYVCEQGRKCAIGIALDNETLRLIVDAGSNSRSVDGLVEEGTIWVEEDELDEMEYLQCMHDKWASNDMPIDDRKKFRDKFECKLAELAEAYPAERV